MPEIDLGPVVGPHFTPSVDTVEGNSVLSWSNDGGLPNPEPVKISPTLVAGENISLNREGDTLRISATAATYQNATASSDGLMSKTDKAKLDGIPADATNNAGTITGITMNGVSKGASGVVDLGTVLTEHQDISGKLDASRLGAANGAAELDANGKVPSAQLPAYVDDVQEYVSLSAFPATGESGKIYVAVDTNRTYRWSGSAYVEISQSIALGETSSTAYRGDRGKVAYDHAQKTSGNPHNVTKNDVGLGNVPNVATNDQTPTYTTAATLTVLTSGEKLSAAFGKIAKGIADLISHLGDTVKHITAAERTAWNNKVDKVSGKGLSTNDYTTAEKLKLESIESGAQVNEVSAEDYNLLYRCVKVFLKHTEINWDEFLTICGYRAERTAYASVAAATAGLQNGDIVVIKLDPSLGHGNEYSRVRQVPISGFTGTYYRETYHAQDT